MIPIEVLTLITLRHNILTYLYYIEIWPSLSLLVRAFSILDRSLLIDLEGNYKRYSICLVYSYYEPPLRPEAQALGAHVAENLIACNEVIRRSRDGSVGSRTPWGSSTAQRTI